jgi:hypothetical protein
MGEALQFAGDLYYPAGATVFFNGNTLVRSGHYNGVRVYTDTAIEPYSIVYVPIQRGLMQPYGSEQVIYVPTRAGLAAPYRLKQ